VLEPEMNPVPVTVILTACPLFPVAGLMLARVGAGFPIVKALVRAALPPPGAGFVTVTVRNPREAPALTEMLDTARVGLVTVTEFTAIPSPKLTAVIPWIKLSPVRVTSRMSPRVAWVGTIALSAGEGF